MAPHSSTLAWRIPWTEEPGGLPVHGVARSRIRLRDFPFTFHFSLSCTGEGNGNPLQCSCLENPRDRGAWWAAVYGVAQSQTRLKQLSSSSSSQTGSFMRFRIIFRVHVLGLSSASSGRLGVRPLARYVTCWNSITPPS